MMTNKLCYKCKQSKPIDAFNKNKHKKDGLATECKICKKSLDKEYFIKNYERINKQASEYRALNREKTNQSAKNSQLKNKEKYKLLKKEWFESNKEKVKEYRKEYKKNNRGKFNASTSEYRAIKLKAIPSWADFTKINCLYSFAAMLNKNSNEKYHVDHIIPLRNKFVCGLHTYDNLRVITAKENIKKSNSFTV